MELTVVHCLGTGVLLDGTGGGSRSERIQKSAVLVARSGRLDVTNRGVDGAHGGVLAEIALLHTHVALVVPEATGINLTGLLGLILGIAGTGTEGDLPLATAVGNTGSVILVLVTVGEAREVTIGIGIPSTAGVLDTVRLVIVGRAGVHAHVVLPLASGVVDTTRAVGDVRADAVAGVAVLLPSALTSAISLRTSGRGHSREVLTAAAASVGVVVPGAHDGPDTLRLVDLTSTVVLASIVSDIPHTALVGIALSLGDALTVGTVNLALTVQPGTLLTFVTLGLFAREVGLRAGLQAAAVGVGPETVRLSVTGGLIRSTNGTVLSTFSIIEPVTLASFILISAGLVAHEHSAAAGATLLDVVVVTHGVSVTLSSGRVSTTVAADLALLGGVTLEPLAPGGVDTGIFVGEGTALLTALILNIIPDTVTASVSIVVTVLLRAVHGASLAASATALHLKG